MAQLKMKKVEETMAVVETDEEFRTVVSKRRKEKRKAPQNPGTESETTCLESESQASVAETDEKKKRKVLKKSRRVEEPVSMAPKGEIPPKDLKARSKDIHQDILNFITAENLSGPLVNKILGAVSDLRELLNEALIKNSFLEGQISALKNETAETSNRLVRQFEEKLKDAVPAKKPLTWAERVGVTVKNVSPMTAKDPRNVVAVFAKNTDAIKSSEDLKAAVQKLVSPREIGIGVRNVRKIPGNGILIETAKKSDLAVLIENKKLKEAGIEVAAPAKRNPRLIVFGVPRPTDDEQAIKEIAEHNFEGENREKVRKNCKVAFKTGDKNKDRCNLVIEMPRQVRELFKGRERLYIGWECCRVQDYVVATRCFKCQSFGHITKHCKAEKEICGHCAEAGHSFKDCKKKDKPAVCSNCKRAGKPANHSVKDKECFAHQAATRVVMEKTDYGQ